MKTETLFQRPSPNLTRRWCDGSWSDGFPTSIGERPKTGVTHKTGVLVIGVPSKTEKLEKEFGGEQRIQDVEFDVDDGSEGEK